MRHCWRPSFSDGSWRRICAGLGTGKGGVGTHHRKSLTDLYGAEVGGEIRDRFTVHYTPTHGSWLNQAEIEIGMFSRQCLGSRRIPDLPTLRRESRAWNRRVNRARIK
ncbi:MAG: transposase, partial [Bryobacteraceae bacterium]